MCTNGVTHGKCAQDACSACAGLRPAIWRGRLPETIHGLPSVEETEQHAIVGLVRKRVRTELLSCPPNVENVIT